MFDSYNHGSVMKGLKRPRGQRSKCICTSSDVQCESLCLQLPVLGMRSPRGIKLISKPPADTLPYAGKHLRTLSLSPSLHSGMPVRNVRIFNAPKTSDRTTEPLLLTKRLTLSTTSKKTSFFLYLMPSLRHETALVTAIGGRACTCAHHTCKQLKQAKYASGQEPWQTANSKKTRSSTQGRQRWWGMK